MAGAKEKFLSGTGLSGESQRNELNVGKYERYLSGAGGAALTLLGLKRGGFGGMLLTLMGGGFIYRATTGHCDLYSKMGVNTAMPEERADTGVWERGIKVEYCITINKPPHELYQFWRNLENLPLFMKHLDTVKQIGPTLSHWTAKAPVKVEWGAEIINDIENSLIAWKSLPEADVDSAGSVNFNWSADGWGTDVKIAMQYRPPAGKVGAALLKLFGQNPGKQIEEDMRNFKQLMEAGEVPTTVGQPVGHFGA